MKKLNLRLIALIMVVICALLGIFGILLLRNSEGVVRENSSLMDRLKYSVNVTDPFNFNKGKVARVSIVFNPQGETISTVGLRVIYSGVGTVVNKDGKSSEIIYPDPQISGENSWDVPVDRVSRDGNKYIIEFAAANLDTEGYSSDEFTQLANIYIELGDGQTLNLSDLQIEPEIAFIMTKEATPINIYDGESNLRLQIEQ